MAFALPNRRRTLRSHRTRSVAHVTLMLAVLLAGCYPVTRVQIPRTTPAGKLHGALGLAISPTGDLRPSPDVALRYGLSDSVDLGLRVRMAALEIGPKIQVVRDDVEVSIAPAFLAAYEDRDFAVEETDSPDDNVNALVGRVSVYVGSNMDREFAAFVAPTFDAGRRTYRDEVGLHSDRLLAPGVLGGILVKPASSIRLLFELGLLLPAGGAGKVGVGDMSSYRYQTLLGPGDTRLVRGLTPRMHDGAVAAAVIAVHDHVTRRG